MDTANAPTYSLSRLARYMLRLGTLGFGGPVALAGYMHRDLVEERGWISEADYKEGLALAQLMPGPLAAQLAMYLGYVHYRILGATVVGFAFVIPSFLMVVALGWAYVRYGGLAWMQATFYGVGAAVIGIIAMSAHKLTSKSIGKDVLLWAIYLVLAAVTVATESEIAWLFVAAGLVAWFCRAPPRWLRGSAAPALFAAQAPLAAAALDWPLLAKVGLFFAKAGAFVFGSGLAIVPFLYGGVVTDTHWLNDRQFVDAVAVAMITPGPVVITVGFIGYLIAGFPGACVAALATFLPCYLFTIIPAPYFKKYGKRPAIVAFVDGVTAAAIGAITGAVIVLAKRSIVDIPTALIAAATLLLLWKFRKLQEPLIVAGAALLGLALYPLSASAGAPALEPLAAIAMPGVKGRIDHFAADVKGHRLFVAALGNDTVEVIDTATRERRTVRGLGEPQGVLFLAPQERLVIANGSAGRVDFVDARTLAAVKRIDGLDDADNVRFDAARGKVLVGYGKGALRVLDPGSAETTGDIRLPGHPESFQVESHGKRAFVNVPATRSVVVVDVEKRATLATWGLDGAASNFPMALDEPSRRLFVGARSPAALVVLDTDTGRIVDRVPIGRDSDDVFFDAASRRVYAVCGEGRVDVVGEESPGHYAVQASITTAPGARTGLFVPEERRLYVAAPATGGSPARILVYRVP
ncbi:MAG TPA: chromate efflux transporter [Usitatibacter sp.]|nr:chromate efflux transporter [Usitatibacter sp.]